MSQIRFGQLGSLNDKLKITQRRVYIPLALWSLLTSAIYFYGLSGRVQNRIDPSIATELLNILVAIGYGVMPIGFLFVIYNSNRSRQKRRTALASFALDNNFIYLPGMKNDIFSGSLFHIGRKRKKLNVIAGPTDNGQIFELFEYSFTTGRGRSEKVSMRSVMRVTIARKLPHMVVNSKRDMAWGGSSTLPLKFHNNQRIELEGDFHKYFNIYAMDNYENEALNVLTPDLMQQFKKLATSCDVEIVDRDVFFIWPHRGLDKARIKEMFAIGLPIAESLSKKSQRNIFTEQSEALLHRSGSLHTPRLAKKDPRLLISISLVVAAVLIWLIYSEAALLGKDLSGLAVAIALIIALGIVFFRYKDDAI